MMRHGGKPPHKASTFSMAMAFIGAGILGLVTSIGVIAILAHIVNYYVHTAH